MPTIIALNSVQQAQFDKIRRSSQAEIYEGDATNKSFYMSCLESLEGTVIDPELLRFFKEETPKRLPEPEVATVVSGRES